jgi:hypothetical protein
MEFPECAKFLMDYFQREHGVVCQDALCLDGGASAQAAWRDGRTTRAEPDLGMRVPTAILIFKK